jgi:hypothetical protein
MNDQLSSFVQDKLLHRDIPINYRNGHGANKRELASAASGRSQTILFPVSTSHRVLVNFADSIH